MRVSVCVCALIVFECRRAQTLRVSSREGSVEHRRVYVSVRLAIQRRPTLAMSCERWMSCER